MSHIGHSGGMVTASAVHLTWALLSSAECHEVAGKTFIRVSYVRERVRVRVR